jgi:hypothetical protein
MDVADRLFVIEGGRRCTRPRADTDQQHIKAYLSVEAAPAPGRSFSPSSFFFFQGAHHG